MNPAEHRSVAARLDNAPRPRESVTLKRASAVPIEPIHWLWRPLLARSKLHLLAGEAGQGKTTIALAMAATVSLGGTWPDSEPCPAGQVLIWSGEDDPADTLAPRLAAMGADMDRVLFIGDTDNRGRSRPFNPAQDIPMLTEAAVAAGGAALIIIDPMVSTISGDPNNQADVRRSMEPLSRLANTLGAAVVGIHHFSKGSAGRSPLDRITGSLAFGAVVRVALAVATVKDTDGTSRRVMAIAKSNIGRSDLGFEYHLDVRELQPGIEGTTVAWGCQLQGRADALLANAPEADEKHTALGDAVAWLREYLTCSTPAATVFEEGAQAGHAEKTIQRASKELPIKKTKGHEGKWYWQLEQDGQHRQA